MTFIKQRNIWLSKLDEGNLKLKLRRWKTLTLTFPIIWSGQKECAIYIDLVGCVTYNHAVYFQAMESTMVIQLLNVYITILKLEYTLVIEKTLIALLGDCMISTGSKAGSESWTCTHWCWGIRALKPCPWLSFGQWKRKFHITLNVTYEHTHFDWLFYKRTIRSIPLTKLRRSYVARTHWIQYTDTRLDPIAL